MLELPLSVVIITLNEESRLSSCLASLPEGCEIIVLDSASTDRTLEIARSNGAKTAVRPFDNYAAQKNAALAMATRRWVFAIDADETMDPELREAIIKIVTQKNSAVSGWTITRRLVFMGRRMRWGKTSDRPLRFFLREAGHYVNAVHEAVQLSTGKKAHLKSGVLWHESYDDITDYFARFNNYTSRIAEQHSRAGRRGPGTILLALRPWAEFISRYFFRLGFLDGYPGYCYALFSSVYTFVKYAKLAEIRGRSS
jgi:glycosyltransferase involved in cell wall biosynthesis